MQSSWSRWRGDGAELLRLAWPLMLSNGVLTLQITIDRILLSAQGSKEIGASMAAALVFWTPLSLCQFTVNYASTFVAQYVGTGQPRRVGPVVWQAVHLSLGMGLAFIALAPWSETVIGWGGHSEEMRQREAVFLYCLCFSALPYLLAAAFSSFFAGRGDSRTVLAINAIGLAVNAGLDYLLIGGNWGFPAWGIAGAGWATVAGSVTSALCGLVLFLRKQYRREFLTLAGWRVDRPLLSRLSRFGVPNGLHWALDGLAFTVFLMLIGRLGDDELSASSIAFSLNLFAFLPTFGVAQAVAILVGQRLGEGRPDLAERSTWAGFALAWLFMAVVGACYLLFPGPLLWFFQGGGPDAGAGRVAELVPVLLRFMAWYCLFDSMNLVLASALKGAGDTLFVTVVVQVLVWPVMIVPTALVCAAGWDLAWAWSAAAAYITVLPLPFLWRFRQGKWKSLRVVEPTAVAPTGTGTSPRLATAPAGE